MAQKMTDRIRYYGGMTSYIGGEGSFAEQALESFIFAHPLLEEENFEREGSDTLESLFDSVASGKYSFGCVPLMNNVSGTIDQTVDLLGTKNVQVIGDYAQHTDACFCILPSTKREAIRSVYSHNRFLGSCSIYLKRFEEELGEKLTRGLSRSTTAAANLVASNPDKPYACICSARAAALNGLTVLDSNIGDDANSSSRFVMISRSPMDLNEYGLCSLRCMIGLVLKNIPGALFKAVSVFAFRECNITNMFTRPYVAPGESHWNVKTFFEFQPESAEQAQEIVEELKRWTIEVKFIGLYPEHLHKSKVQKQSFQNLVSSITA